MIALKTLGVICVILICFSSAITVIVEAFQKSEPTINDNKNNKKLSIKGISYWDYLILILPASLLLIGIFTKDIEEKKLCFLILGIGYAFLLLTSYNNRIDNPWIKRSVVITSIILAVTSFFLSFTHVNFNFQSGLSSLTILLFPMMTISYLLTIRFIIFKLSNTYPLTLDKYFRVGHYSKNLQRKANFWDLFWTLWNMVGFPAFVIYLLVISK